ncbi:hypothetical protein [Neptuniibacter sp. QD37_11]|uniref:hypothetical protein n=1 Tax=Neptuniibacter sp. QD37_11 TaxID=3398209 RepID=UPI0039F5F51B
MTGNEIWLVDLGLYDMLASAGYYEAKSVAFSALNSLVTLYISFLRDLFGVYISDWSENGLLWASLMGFVVLRYLLFKRYWRKQIKDLIYRAIDKRDYQTYYGLLKTSPPILVGTDSFDYRPWFGCSADIAELKYSEIKSCTVKSVGFFKSIVVIDADSYGNWWESRTVYSGNSWSAYRLCKRINFLRNRPQKWNKIHRLIHGHNGTANWICAQVLGVLFLGWILAQHHYFMPYKQSTVLLQEWQRSNHAEQMWSAANQLKNYQIQKELAYSDAYADLRWSELSRMQTKDTGWEFGRWNLLYQTNAQHRRKLVPEDYGDDAFALSSYQRLEVANALRGVLFRSGIIKFGKPIRVALPADYDGNWVKASIYNYDVYKLHYDMMDYYLQLKRANEQNLAKTDPEAYAEVKQLYDRTKNRLRSYRMLYTG